MVRDEWEAGAFWFALAPTTFLRSPPTLTPLCCTFQVARSIGTASSRKACSRQLPMPSCKVCATCGK